MVSLLFWVCFVTLTKSQLVISINAHGGYYGAKKTSVIDWPYNVDVIFFVGNGLDLPNSEGLRITRAYELQMYDIVKKWPSYSEVIGRGGKMPDYIFEYGLEFATSSGLYIADERVHADPAFWFQLTPGLPIRLVDFVKTYIHGRTKEKTTILWNACRTYLGPLPAAAVFSKPDSMTSFTTTEEGAAARELAFRQCRHDLDRSMKLTRQRYDEYIAALSSRITPKLSRIAQATLHDYIEQIKQHMGVLFLLSHKAAAKADVWQCNVYLYDELKKYEQMRAYYKETDAVIVTQLEKGKKKTDGDALMDKIMSSAATSGSVAHKQIDNYYDREEYTESAHSEYGNKLTYYDNDLQSDYSSLPLDYYTRTSAYYPSISLLLLFVAGVLVFISICCVINCALCYLLGVSDIFNICRGNQKYRENDNEELQDLNQL